MSLQKLCDLAESGALVLLSGAIFLVLLRLFKGPTLTDRVLALDLMTTIAIGIMATFAIQTRQSIYLDVALVLSMVAFVSTVVYARYLERVPHAKKGEKK